MEGAVFLQGGQKSCRVQETGRLKVYLGGIQQQGLVMGQAGIGDPLTRWLLENPFNGMGSVDQELLSIR